MNKIVDLKSTSKLTSSLNSNESKDIFQTVEDSDFLTTKQLIKTNENLINA